VGFQPLTAIPIPETATKHSSKSGKDKEKEAEPEEDSKDSDDSDDKDKDDSEEEEETMPEDHVVTAPEWDPQLDFDAQIFPSYLIASATMVDDDADESLLGDTRGILGISITVPKEDTKVKVTVKGNKLMEASSWSGTIPKANKTYFISPKIAYDYDALAKVRQQSPISLNFSVEINDSPAETRIATATVHSINDCPFGVAESEEMGSEDSGYDNIGWMFAAYVNESHPWIDKVLKDALDSGIVNSFDGYQSGDPDHVLAQIYAIWDVFHRRGVKYSNVTNTPSGSKLVYSQHVRFLEECAASNQANCVDGSVLFAAILRKISLSPFLIIVPGHMYVAVVLGKDNIIGLETTAMGMGEVKRCDMVDGMLKKLPKEKQKLPSLNTFAFAVKYGTDDLEKHKDDFGDENKADYQLIDIAKARKDGVMPIPYTKE
jgi:hypothetical protein